MRALQGTGVDGGAHSITHSARRHFARRYAGQGVGRGGEASGRGFSSYRTRDALSGIRI